MSKKAEQAALKAYPIRRYGNYGYKDMNDGHRKAYREGYEQAEKDLKLISEDIKTLYDIIALGDTVADIGTEEFYSEVAERFNKTRK